MQGEWQTQYSRFNRDNLESLDVIKEQGSKYCFVEETHPVMVLLQHNQTNLGMDLSKINTEQKEDGKQYYKVSDQVMKESCDLLKNEVFGIMQERQINVADEWRAIKCELEWQKECFRLLFTHMGVEFPEYKKQ